MLKDKERKKEYDKQYRLKNKERSKQYYLENKEHQKQYKLEHKENIKEYQKQYYLNNKEDIKQYSLDRKEHIETYRKEYIKKYYLNNKEAYKQYQNKYRKERYRIDPEYVLLCNLRCRVINSLNSQNVKKSLRTTALIGCTTQFLKEYLESKFKEGMSWENRSSFHIDHIKPCSSFNLLDEEEQKKCFHYTNLQPLTPEENMKKSDRY